MGDRLAEPDLQLQPQGLGQWLYFRLPSQSWQEPASVYRLWQVPAKVKRFAGLARIIRCSESYLLETAMYSVQRSESTPGVHPVVLSSALFGVCVVSAAAGAAFEPGSVRATFWLISFASLVQAAVLIVRARRQEPAVALQHLRAIHAQSKARPHDGPPPSSIPALVRVAAPVRRTDPVSPRPLRNWTAAPSRVLDPASPEPDRVPVRVGANS